MMLILSAEWLRFRRGRANIAVVVATLLLLCASAWFAGSTAASYRAYQQARHAAWDAHLAAAHQAAPAIPGAESSAAAGAAYAFGRGLAPPALRPAPGGLVLSVQQFLRQPVDIQVSLDTRHLDPRRGAPLGNPLLDSLGVPDFAVVAAILLPLAVIALCYGVAHEPREQGIWRLLGARAPVRGQLLWAALAIRWAAVTGVAALASLLAFALDPGSGVAAWLAWSGHTALYVLLWVLVAGLFNTIRMSSATCALAMAALLLMLNVVAPAMLQNWAAAHAPMPAREATVLQVRAIGQQADDDITALLDNWYASHPAQRPASFITHTWPVSYVPKTVWHDSRVAPLMGGFERARSAQAQALAPWLWISPGLALVRSGDYLAGTDPVQLEHYAHAVEQLERRWRSVLAPAVMGYRGLSDELLARLPAFDAPLAPPPQGGLWPGIGTALAALAAALVYRSGRLPV